MLTIVIYKGCYEFTKPGSLNPTIFIVALITFINYQNQL